MWRSISVFVSSTFEDMHAERDYLREHIIPELEERLRHRRYHLNVIDLRWGVFTDDSKRTEERELEIVSVCLAEIKRCRPFFVGLVGGRSGWIPHRSLIEAVAGEQGLKIGSQPLSITGLEFEAGAWDCSSRRHAIVMVREAILELPPMHAPVFSDLEAGRSHEALCLQQLKSRLYRDLPDRVHGYSARWDRQTKRITGLEAFGEALLSHLWAELDAETSRNKGSIHDSEDEDEILLSEFVEEKTRTFVGRSQLLQSLLKQVREPDATLIAVTGGPGTGKSTIFAKLWLELQNLEDLVVLAHSSAAGWRAVSVSGMVTRFTKKLAVHLGIAPPVAASSDEVDQTFGRLLSRVAASKRVILLLDALDQFERTPRADYLRWLPRNLPKNVSIVATGVPCSGMETLVREYTAQATNLEPLPPIDARKLATSHSLRYGRKIDSRTLDALTSKRNTDGTLSCGNPLWLTVATQQLNLLRADEFLRTAESSESDAEERIRRILDQTVQAFPPDVEGIFASMLERLERVHGVDMVRAFAPLIVVGRQGWREQDLRELLRKTLQSPIRDLDLASLRRSFRDQLLPRGPQQFFVFSHQQLIRSILERYVEGESRRREINSTIADYLRSLPADDPVKNENLIHHLLRAGRIADAVKYFSSTIGSPELHGAVARLADDIVVLENKGMDPGEGASELLAAVINEGSITLNEGIQFFALMVTKVDQALIDRLPLRARKVILERAIEPLERLAETGYNDSWLIDTLVVAQQRLGDVMRGMDETGGTLKHLDRALAHHQKVVAEKPRDVRALRNLALSHFTTGQVQASRGVTAEAEQSFLLAKGLAEDAAAIEPDNPLHQSGVAAINDELGKIYLARKKPNEARACYEDAVRACKHAIGLDPENNNWHSDFATSLTGLAGVLERVGQLRKAIQLYEDARAIRERLLYRIPNPDYALAALGISHLRLSWALLSALKPEEALLAAVEAHAIFSILTKQSDPDNAQWQDLLKQSSELLEGLKK